LVIFTVTVAFPGTLLASTFVPREVREYVVEGYVDGGGGVGDALAAVDAELTVTVASVTALPPDLGARMHSAPVTLLCTFATVTIAARAWVRYPTVPRLGWVNDDTVRPAQPVGNADTNSTSPGMYCGAPGAAELVSWKL
jgi:hypothetical protein